MFRNKNELLQNIVLKMSDDIPKSYNITHGANYVINVKSCLEEVSKSKPWMNQMRLF